MRISMVMDSYPRQTFIERQVEELIRRGHTVHILVRRKNPWPRDSSPALRPHVVVLAPGVRRLLKMVSLIVRCMGRRPVQLFRAVGKLLSTHGLSRTFLSAFYRALQLMRIQPDVVHIQFSGMADHFLPTMPAVTMPLVASCQGSGLEVQASLAERDREVRRAAFGGADRVHVLASSIGDEIVRLGIPADKISIIRPGIPVDGFPPKDHYNESVDEIRLVSVGRINWVKGYEYAFEAVRRLLDRGIEVTYTVVGGGDPDGWAPVLLARHQLGLKERVIFTGRIERTLVSGPMTDADVFLLPSVEEGLAYVTIEAMSTGLPIVASDVGGVKDAITDGVEGLLVRPRDPEALADAIERLVKDPRLRREMGMKGRARVEKEFHLDRFVDEFEDLYREVITSSPP